MVNKKYLLLAGICTVMAASPVFAQESESGAAKWSSRDMTYRGQNYDVLDSSYVPASRMEQHRKYLNHQYAFPSKPRNMWEIGVGGGLLNVIGDVPTLMLWNGGGYGFHAHVRKAWGHVLSTRLQYNYGIAKGLDYELASPQYISSEPAWNGLNNGLDYSTMDMDPVTGVPAGRHVVRNYRTEMHQLNFDVIGSINNIRFYKARTSMSLFGYVGLGARAYKVRYNTMDDETSGYTAAAAYDFENDVSGGIEGTYKNRKDFRKAVQDNMDKSYETGDTTFAGARILDDKRLSFAPSVGVGAQFRLSKRVNLQIEDRYTLGTGDDLLDGHRWSGNALTPGWDGVNYFSLGLNFNLGNKRKSVEPLYWLNPLDHAYNELSYPRHMILPDPVLPDADGDGITDQFDKCPGTPSGVSVDSHGCPMDTDGDGVPDDRDKQLITPTECQPVDADGVGKCPCPDGCGQATPCSNIGAGSVSFDNNSSNLRPAAQSQLATLSAQMQSNPTCKVVIIGSGNGSKIQQQRSWDRVNAIIEYMSEKNGIDRNRFIFQYGQAGDANSVMYRSAMQGEEGPANVAPPFPNLRRD